MSMKDWTEDPVLTPHDLKIKMDLMDDKLKFLVADFTRLKTIEKEYNTLIQLLQVSAKFDQMERSHTIVIKIREDAMIHAPTFKEALETAKLEFK